jgi:hypothetical protein
MTEEGHVVAVWLIAQNVSAILSLYITHFPYGSASWKKLR